jgi:hypothetical protein
MKRKERVMGFEPTNSSLGSCCLTTWQHPHPRYILIDLFSFRNLAWITGNFIPFSKAFKDID